MERVIERVCNEYKSCERGVLNGYVRDRMRVGMTGGFGVPEEYDNGRRVISFCSKRGLCVGNI